LGANVVVLPGIKLAEHTIVAAGAVVTKSFLDGDCVIAGVPAKVVKKIDSYKGQRTVDS
jgi:acetyltransferase-like isoleucine patch superfamily enzyme